MNGLTYATATNALSDAKDAKAANTLM